MTSTKDAAGLSTKLEKSKLGIVQLETVEIMSVYKHEKFMGEVKRRHAERVNVQKETARENLESLINDVKAAQADTVKEFVV